MARAVEKTCQSVVWEWLTEDQGYEAVSEVELGSAGEIDLVTEKDSGVIAGYEVKDSAVFPQKLEDTFEQLVRYSNSGYLDELYLCCQNASGHVSELQRARSITSENLQELDSQGSSELSGLGAVSVPIESVNDSSQVSVEINAARLQRSKKPDLTPSYHEQVCHQLWQKISGRVFREGALPNPDSVQPLHIDMISLGGTVDPTEIYRNQNRQGYWIEAIEIKTTEFSSKPEVKDTLRRYRESGGLTHLSLATVPKYRQKAEEVLSITEQSTLSGYDQNKRETDVDNPLEDVGLYLIDDDGMVDTVREPSEFRMRYDGFQGPPPLPNYKEVGFGKMRPEDSFESIRHPSD